MGEEISVWIMYDLAVYFLCAMTFVVPGCVGLTVKYFGGIVYYMLNSSFNALSLLIGQHGGHLDCKKSCHNISRKCTFGYRPNLNELL